MSGFFHKIFGGGLAFGDDFSVPVGDGVRRGEGGLTPGMESDEGDLEKLSAKAKNAPHSKIRANFGVLSIK